MGGKSGIHIKEENKGKLHKALGIAEGKKIPASKLKTKGKSTEVKREITFAKNAKKWNHHHKGGK